MTKLGTPITGIGFLFTAYYQAKGPLLFRCQLQVNSNLGSHLAGTGLANYNLILSWGPFSGQVFLNCGSQPVQGLIMHLLTGSLSCQHHHCIIGVRKFCRFLWHLLDPPTFSTLSRNE